MVDFLKTNLHYDIRKHFTKISKKLNIQNQKKYYFLETKNQYLFG